MIAFDRFVLAASTATLDEEPMAREHADAVEFRMDLADRPLDQLASYQGTLPIIATNRADWEGGKAAEEGRLTALERAVEHGSVGAIDVELESLRSDGGRSTADHARDHDASVIASIHDFEGSPERERMTALLGEAVRLADVGKLAVTATARRDVLDLLSVTDAADRDGWAVATMAMGRVGRHSRIVAPIYGSKIGYAPVDSEEATAPGQYDLSTMARLIARLG